MENSKEKSERYEYYIKCELEMICGQISEVHGVFRNALFRPDTTMDEIDLEYSISKETRIDAAKEQIAHYLMNARLLKRIQKRVEGA